MSYIYVAVETNVCANGARGPRRSSKNRRLNSRVFVRSRLRNLDDEIAYGAHMLCTDYNAGITLNRIKDRLMTQIRRCSFIGSRFGRIGPRSD